MSSSRQFYLSFPLVLTSEDKGLLNRKLSVRSLQGNLLLSNWFVLSGNPFQTCLIVKVRYFSSNDRLSVNEDLF